MFLLKSASSIAQTGKENYFPPTPEANSLIKHVDVPVNYSTGATNYSIPIHTIKLKEVNIPITLSYQSSGFKPSEIASNVGFGWELNAGGKITQNIVGKNDLEYNGASNNFGSLANEKDFKLPTPVMDLVWGQQVYTQRQLDSIRAAGTDYARLYDIDQYGTDTKPDMYYYSIPNKSGKFFFGNFFETKQIPFGKEKILYNSANGTFEIVDTDGTRYIYNIKTQNFNSTENVCQKFPKLNGTSNSSTYTFYLTQIITTNNETVDFIYDNIVKYSLYNDKDYTRYYHWFFGGGEKVTSFYSEITAKVLTKIKVNQDYEIEFLYNNYRKDIKGTLQASAPKSLDVINVKYKNTVETYNFSYGYFGIADNTYNPSLFESILVNDDTNYRLKLKSFQKIGETPYVFSYYNEFASSRYPPNLDHWGYLSSQGGKYTMNTLFNDLGSSKEPSLESSKTNILKGVILPTKGEVEFNYELNTCSDCDIEYKYYDWDSFGVYANTDDVYSNEWLTDNKIVFTVPEKIESVPFVSFNLISAGEATTSNYAIAELYDDQNHRMNFELAGTTGNNSKQYIGDPLLPGKTYTLFLKCYDTMENENKFVMINFLKSTTVKNVISNVGGLRIQSIKTKDSNSYVTDRSFDYIDQGKSSGILYERPSYYDEYAYFNEGSDPDANTMGNGLVSLAVQYSRIPSDLFGFNGYHIFYKKVTEKNNDVKNSSNIIKTEKYFTFDDDLRYGEQSYFSKVSYNWKRGLPLQINEFNQAGIARKTVFSYKFWDTPVGTNTSKYESGFPINNPTQPNEFYKRGIDLSAYRRSSHFYNLYQYSNSRLISAWYYMDKKTVEETLSGSILKTEENYKYNNTVHAQLTSQTTINSKGETLETKYYYPGDLLGEPLMAELNNANRIDKPILTETYRAGGLIARNKTVYAKDATTGDLILPKDLYSAKFPNSLPNISNVGNLEKKITYNQYDDKGNVLQYTPENGTPVSIIWGYRKTMPLAKIENVVYSSIPAGTISNLQALSDADNDNCLTADCTEQLLRAALNTFRGTLPNAFITTYTYNALVGVTSVTDPRGISSYYEYDAVGRLKFVKDQDLNVLQKYCYNYKGQQVNCADNTSTSVIFYKNIAKSVVIARNNCPAGGTPQSATYTVPAGRYSSDVSQAAADAKAQDDIDLNGQIYANTNAKCIFVNAAKSVVIARNNCAVGGTPQSATYTVPAGRHSSDVSQAAADAKAQDDIDLNGQTYANTNAKCIFVNAAKSVVIARNNCAAGGTPQSATYTVPAGRYNSDVSQAAADAKAQDDISLNGQAYANANAKCIFVNTAKSVVIARNNCAVGGTPQSTTYTVPAGRHNSDVSQAAADAKAQDDVSLNGQAYANANAKCIFVNAAISVVIARNNCAVGGTPQSATYTVPAGRHNSDVSQAAADAKAQDDVSLNGQAYANANAKCIFVNAAKSVVITRNNCPAGGTPQSVTYTVPAGRYNSDVSQAAADLQAQNEVVNNGQNYANDNNNAKCIFLSAAKSVVFARNNCPAGGTPQSVTYTVPAGRYNSDVSQAAADLQAQNDVANNGQNYANDNNNAKCIFSSVAKSGVFTRNNCAAGGTPQSVTYIVPAGRYSSDVSQAVADARAQDDVSLNGQIYANANAYCTFRSKLIVYQIYKNDYCPPGTTFPYVYYIVDEGAYQSNASQADADNKAWADVAANAQAYANANGRCLDPGETEE